MKLERLDRQRGQQIALGGEEAIDRGARVPSLVGHALDGELRNAIAREQIASDVADRTATPLEIA